MDVGKAKQLIAQAKSDGVSLSTPLHVQAEIGLNPHADEIIQYIAQSLRHRVHDVNSQMRDKASMEKDWTSGFKAISADRGMVGFQSHGQELMDFSGSCPRATPPATAPRPAYCDPKLDKMYNSASP